MVDVQSLPFVLRMEQLEGAMIVNVPSPLLVTVKGAEAEPQVRA
jgi:hypothetical protein